jgi:hypothetical protein
LSRFKRTDENRLQLERPAERKCYIKQNKREPENVSTEQNHTGAENIVHRQNNRSAAPFVPVAKKDVAPIRSTKANKIVTKGKTPAKEPTGNHQIAEQRTADPCKTKNHTTTQNAGDKKNSEQKSIIDNHGNEHGQGNGESQGLVEVQGQKDQGQTENQGQTEVQQGESNSEAKREENPPETEKGKKNEARQANATD